ncbi:hypothetical protein [Phaeospirillum tilakii]|uniref:Tetratricopeptide repeat-containing protein n=1 Tax=Phaeospirillum tilakii TaxID=741673 RepID=A0ABW5CE66_9PROT
MSKEDEAQKRAERLKRARALAARGGASGPTGPSSGPSVPAPPAPPASPPAPAVPGAPPKPEPGVWGDAPARPGANALVESAQASSSLTAASADATRSLRASLLDMITGLLKPRSAPSLPVPVVLPPPEPPLLTVLLAALDGDSDGTAATQLFQVLTARPQFKVKPLAKLFQLPGFDDPTLVTTVAMNTRHTVVEAEGDLLLWGELTADGYALRLTTPSGEDDRFGPPTRIELPREIDDTAANLLFAALLAAAEPGGESRRAALRRLLLPAAQAIEPLAQRPPVALTMPQQRSVQVIYGHVAATLSTLVGAEQAGPWADRAVTAYRQAARRLGRTDPAWEGGLLHRAVAGVIAAKADRAKDPAPLLEESITEWRAAAEAIPRAMMPQDWASIQTRLGAALFRLDLMTGRIELLREALQTLQSTLQVYTRTETPNRWADVMHTLAQVLEVYGDQLRSVEVLERAVEACHQVLEIRTRDRTPLTWASIQNTLGSTLFLLDRHSSEGAGHLAEAEVALMGALEVFQLYRARRPAKVAARNLDHVRRLIESRRNRAVVEPHWLHERSR